MTVLLDTGFLFAMQIKRDPYHKRASEVAREIDWKKGAPIITTDLAVNETFSLTVRRTKANPAAIHKIRDLFWGDDNFFTIYSIPLEEYPSIVSIIEKYANPNRLLSFVDASLIYLGEKFKNSTLVTFDSHYSGLFNTIYQ